jgi:2-dehydropantoate 2-reductase
MRICIYGAGAIGATIGARLAASGHAVSLVARGAHLDAIRRDGLVFVDHVGNGRQTAGGNDSGTYRLAASDQPAELGQHDVVFLATKAQQLPQVLAGLAPLLGPGSVVVPAINGLPWWYFQGLTGPRAGLMLRALDPAGTMAEALSWRRIVGCVLHLAAERTRPGEVHSTAGRRLILGEPDRTDSGRLRAVALLLESAGFAVERSPDIRRDIWVKLIGNLSFNPVAALTGYRMDQICADAELLTVIRQVLQEGAAVAAGVGIDVGMSAEQRIGIARQLGEARISMLQDLENGRSLELAPIVGAVIEMADLLGIAVPATRTVHALAQARARALGLPAV